MFVRKVKTSSGATAVQVAQRVAGRDEIINHIGSAHTSEEIALVVLEAKKHIQAGLLAFDLDDLAVTSVGTAVAESYTSRLLRQVLEDASYDYGFEQVIGDEAFKQLVLARLIKPTSKLATVATLETLGIQACSVRSSYQFLQRASERDYSSRVESACVDWAMGRGTSPCGSMTSPHCISKPRTKTPIPPETSSGGWDCPRNAPSTPDRGGTPGRRGR